MNSWQQNCIPQHLLSRLMGKLASAKLGKLTQWGIKQFIAHYKVNMDEAAISDYSQFETFNDFFTRALKPGARIISQENNSVVSPVDGCISEIGTIEKNQLLQAKGTYYSLENLCGDSSVAAHFENGSFLTAYLSPKDYHRFHMPFAGQLLQMRYMPGKLYSVNVSSVENVPGLFAKNERVVCLFETAIGKMAVIPVGAMIVGSIAMNWHGVVVPGSRYHWNYESQSLCFDKGNELGHFRLGSTVIMLFEKNRLAWDAQLAAGKSLRLGDVIAHLK